MAQRFQKSLGIVLLKLIKYQAGMLKEVRSSFEEWNKVEKFDPSVFHDSVAMRTAWTPVMRRGSNIRSHILKERHPGCLEFRANILFSILFWMLCLFCVFIGIMLLLIDVFYWQISVGALIFAGLLLWGHYYIVMPVVSDKSLGYFWRGWKKPGPGRDSARTKHRLPLDEIHAVQLIASRMHVNPRETLRFYELNLIDLEGGRFRLVNHNHFKGIQDDARKLAHFLGKPLWDASGVEGC